jgi:hypothetical protein
MCRAAVHSLLVPPPRRPLKLPENIAPEQADLILELTQAHFA